MNIERLKEYYNRIDKCSVVINREVDFDFIQTQIGKIAVYTEEINRVMGEILVDKTKLEHLMTDKQFEYELNFTENNSKNKEVERFSTGKERRDYINYVLLKDSYRDIKNLEQELKDLESLLELAKKKAKDLDRTYPKLRTLWESVQAEMKFLKKQGSDSEYMDKVKNSIKEDQQNSKPLFDDGVVEKIKEDQYNLTDVLAKEESVEQNNFVTDQNTSIDESILDQL